MELIRIKWKIRTIIYRANLIMLVNSIFTLKHIGKYLYIYNKLTKPV
jgi:hypothetical protein